MKELLLVTGAGVIVFFAIRGIAKDISAVIQAKKSEVELLKMESAYLEGVKSCQTGQDWQERWAELEREFAAK